HPDGRVLAGDARRAGPEVRLRQVVDHERRGRSVAVVGRVVLTIELVAIRYSGDRNRARLDGRGVLLDQLRRCGGHERTGPAQEGKELDQGEPPFARTPGPEPNNSCRNRAMARSEHHLTIVTDATRR